MSNQNNPRAFPLPHFEQHGNFFYQDGMTLRDWFAGQVIGQAAQADHQNDWGKSGKDHAPRAAAFAYRIADAMLAEREKAQP